MAFSLGPSGKLDTGTGLSIGGKVLGGLVAGAREDPLLRPLVDHLVESGGEERRAEIERMAQAAQSTTIGSLSEFVGSYGPTLAMGLGAFSLGKAALTAGIRGMAPRLAASSSPMLRNQALRIMARAAGSNVGIPLLERGAMAAGGSLGIGTLQGVEALAEGQPLTEAAKSAALGAAFTLGIEGALIGAGAALSPHVRRQFAGPAVAERATAHFKGTAAPLLGKSRLEFVKDKSGKIIGQRGVLPRLRALEAQKRKLLGVDQYERELQEALPGLAAAPAPVGQPSLFPTTAGPAQQSATVLQAAAGRAQRLGKLEQHIGKLRTQAEALTRMEKAPESLIPDLILRDRPVSLPDNGLGMLRRLFRRTLEAPEATSSKLGITGLKFAQDMEDGLIQLQRLEKVHEGVIRNFAQDLGKAIGAPLKISNYDDIVKASAKLRPVIRAFEEGEIQGVRSAFGDKAADIFTDLAVGLRRAYAPVERMGGAPFLTDIGLATQGLRAYFPHVMQDRGFEEIRKSMVAALMRKGIGEADALARVERALDTQRLGVRRFGSFDYNRLTPGSLASKLDDGQPFEPELVGLLRYLNESAKRVTIGRIAGINGELRDKIVGAAVAEGADPGSIGSLVDNLLGRNIASYGARRLAQTVTSAEIASSMTFSALPNFMQPAVNNPLLFSVKNTAKGIRDVVRGAVPRDIELAVALQDDLLQMYHRTHAGVQAESVVDKVARVAMKGSLFTGTERFARASAAITSMYQIQDDIGRALAGRLRGIRLDEARRRLSRGAGLDLSRIVSHMKGNPTHTVEQGIAAVHGKDALLNSVFKLTRETQFMPIPTRVPELFRTPLGRAMFQFKSFALNQGKLLRDQVIAEAALGNIRPLAYFLSVYPVAGELVAHSLAVLKGKDRPSDGLDRLIQDITAVGGIGLVSSLLTAARYGELTDALLGPGITDLTTFGDALLSADVNGLRRQILAKPIVVAGRQLAGLADLTARELLQVVEQMAEAEQEESVTLDDLVARSKQ